MAAANTRNAATERRARLSARTAPHPMSLPPASHPMAEPEAAETEATESGAYQGLETWTSTIPGVIQVWSWDAVAEAFTPIVFDGSAKNGRRAKTKTLLSADVAHNLRNVTRDVEDADNPWLNGMLVRVDVDDEEQMTDERLIDLVESYNATQFEVFLAGIESEVVVRRIRGLIADGKVRVTTKHTEAADAAVARYKKTAGQKSMNEATATGEKPPKFVR